MATTVFTKAQWRSGTEIVTPWIEFSLTPYPIASPTVFRWAKHGHSDISNYGDYKAGQVRSFGRILRALSDREGNILSANFGFSINDDVDGTAGIGSLGAALSDANAQFWFNRIARVLMIGSSGRAAVDDAMVLARGFVTSYHGRDKHVFDFTCDDFLTSAFSPFNGETLLPRRVIGTAQFPNCPAETLGLAESIIYGEITDIPDGINKGAIPTIHVGAETISGNPNWQAFLVSGHAMKLLAKIYSGGAEVDGGRFGVDILAPGFTGWPFANVYRDIGGRRYCLIYALGPLADAAIDGSAPLTVNGQGIEDAGTGAGTLIDSLPLQFRHFLINFVFQSYLTGAWLGNPIFSPAEPTITKVNSASFDQVHTDHVARAPGGVGYYRGAWMLGPGGLVDVKDAIREGLISNDCQGGFDENNSFFIVTDDGTTTVADLDETDILDGPVPIEPDMATLQNIIPYVWKPNYTDYQRASSSGRRTGASVDAWQTERGWGDEVFLSWIRDDLTALSAANYKAARRKDPERLSRIRVPLYGLHWALGSKIRITLAERNWANRVFRIEQKELSLDDYSVELVIRDMTATPVSATTTTVAYDSRTGQSTSGFTLDPTSAVTVVALARPSPGGGSMSQGVNPSAGTDVDVPEYIDMEIDWDAAASFNAYFRVQAKTQDAAVSAIPKIYDVTGAATLAVAGAATTSVTPATQTITLTRPSLGGVKIYRLRVTRGSNATSARVFAACTVKLAP